MGVIFLFFIIEEVRYKKIGESNWKRWKTLDCERFGRLPRKYFSRDPSRPAKFGSKFLRKLIGDLLVAGKLFKEIVRSISTSFSLSLSVWTVLSILAYKYQNRTRERERKKLVFHDYFVIVTKKKEKKLKLAIFQIIRYKIEKLLLECHVWRFQFLIFSSIILLNISYLYYVVG